MFYLDSVRFVYNFNAASTTFLSPSDKSALFSARKVIIGILVCVDLAAL